MLNLVLEPNNKDMDEKRNRMSFLYIQHSLFNHHKSFKVQKVIETKTTHFHFTFVSMY